MDPNATIQWLREAVAAGNRAAASSCARDLIEWLSRGGFPPKGMTAEEARAECERWLR